MSDNFLQNALERMIDSQIANAEAITRLKGDIDVTKSDIKEIKTLFTNGFRSDIKEALNRISQLEKTSDGILVDVHASQKQLNEIKAAITQKQEELKTTVTKKQEEIVSKQEEIVTEVQAYSKIGFWVKVIAGFVVAIGSIAAAVVAVVKAMAE